MLETKRHEHKFRLHEFEAKVIKGKLHHLLRSDQYCNGEGYLVTSLYYDDPVNKAYFDKLNGLPDRYKYRLRYYGLNPEVFKLEKKAKRQQVCQKTSVILTPEEAKLLMNQEYEFLKGKKEPLCLEFYDALSKKGLTSKVLVRYKRHAYAHQIGQLRVTFDEEITSNKNCTLFPKVGWKKVIEPYESILEVKFNGVIPEMVTKVIGLERTFQTSESKYMYARENLA